MKMKLSPLPQSRVLPVLLLAALFTALLAACGNDDNEGLDGPLFEELVNPTVLMQYTDSASNTYNVGYDQVSSQNQDAYIEKINEAGTVLWRRFYSRTPVDERAQMVFIDTEQRLWAVFTVDGGSTSNDYITKRRVADGAFNNAVFRGYGRASGSAKVVVLARLRQTSGVIEAGTFMMARTNEGNIDAVEKTNTFVATEILDAGKDAVALRGDSFFLPPAAGSNQGNFMFHPDATAENKTGNVWKMEFVFNADLSQLQQATINPN